MFEKIRNTLIATAILYLICGIIMLFFPTNVINFACYLIGIIFFRDISLTIFNGILISI